jgi:hypothetical protein
MWRVCIHIFFSVCYERYILNFYLFITEITQSDCVMCLSVHMFHLWYYWTDFVQILCVKSCHVNLLLDRISPGFPTPMKLKSNLNVFFSAFSDHKNNYVQHKYISYWGVELVWNIFYMACNLWSTKKHKFWLCNTWVWTCYNRFVWAINGKTTFAKCVLHQSTYFHSCML